MAQDGSQRFNWARLPLIATIARLLCRVPLHRRQPNPS